LSFKLFTVGKIMKVMFKCSRMNSTFVFDLNDLTTLYTFVFDDKTIEMHLYIKEDFLVSITLQGEQQYESFLKASDSWLKSTNENDFLQTLNKNEFPITINCLSIYIRKGIGDI